MGDDSRKPQNEPGNMNEGKKESQKSCTKEQITAIGTGVQFHHTHLEDCIEHV